MHAYRAIQSHKQQFLIWLLLLTAVWLVLTEGSVSSLLVGVPFILLATVYLIKRQPSGNDQFSLLGLSMFITFFFTESIKGAIDVAYRVLSPSKNWNPMIVKYETALVGLSAKTLFANSVSLLPGTLTIRLDNNELTLHTLDARSDFIKEIARLEAKIAAVYCEDIEHRKDLS